MPEINGASTPSAKDIAQRGENIYREKYQTGFEETSFGKFVAVNVNSSEAIVADTPEDAIRMALENDSSGLFHLMRVGYKAAFESGWYMSCAG